jgi:hypothetical protein
MLQRLMFHNDKIPLLPCVRSVMSPGSLTPMVLSENLTRFHSGSVPNISVLDYLKRIVRFTNVEVRSIPIFVYIKTNRLAST